MTKLVIFFLRYLLIFLSESDDQSLNVFFVIDCVKTGPRRKHGAKDSILTDCSARYMVVTA